MCTSGTDPGDTPSPEREALRRGIPPRLAQSSAAWPSHRPVFAAGRLRGVSRRVTHGGVAGPPRTKLTRRTLSLCSLAQDQAFATNTEEPRIYEIDLDEREMVSIINMTLDDAAHDCSR